MMMMMMIVKSSIAKGRDVLTRKHQVGKDGTQEGGNILKENGVEGHSDIILLSGPPSLRSNRGRDEADGCVDEPRLEKEWHAVVVWTLLTLGCCYSGENE